MSAEKANVSASPAMVELVLALLAPKRRKERKALCCELGGECWEGGGEVVSEGKA